MEIDNARGYAFTALRNAHARQLKWTRYAAARKYGYYPSLYDYTEDGLELFDRMYATATHDLESVQDIIYIIIQEMAKSMDAMHKGHFTYLTKGRASEFITTAHDVILDQPLELFEGDDDYSTIGSVIPSLESGYAEFENTDLMKMRMRLLTKRLSEEDMRALGRYIEGATFEDAVLVGSTQSFIKRIRAACSGLQGSPVFG